MSSATWATFASVTSYAWTGFNTLAEAPPAGIDFVPSITSTHAIWHLSVDRPIVLWEASTLTASGSSARMRP